jgi:hypothetical protein
MIRIQLRGGDWRGGSTQSGHGRSARDLCWRWRVVRALPGGRVLNSQWKSGRIIYVQHDLCFETLFLAQSTPCYRLRMRYNNKCWTTIHYHEGLTQERSFSPVIRSFSSSCIEHEKIMIDGKGCLLCLPLCLESTSHRDQTRVIRKNGTEQEKPSKTHS